MRRLCQRVVTWVAAALSCLLVYNPSEHRALCATLTALSLLLGATHCRQQQALAQGAADSSESKKLGKSARTSSAEATEMRCPSHQEEQAFDSQATHHHPLGVVFTPWRSGSHLRRPRLWPSPVSHLSPSHSSSARKPAQHHHSSSPTPPSSSGLQGHLLFATGLGVAVRRIQAPNR